MAAAAVEAPVSQQLSDLPWLTGGAGRPDAQHRAPEHASTASGSASVRGSQRQGGYQPFTPHRAGSTARHAALLTPNSRHGGRGAGGKTQMPHGYFSRRLQAPLPTPLDAMAPSSKAHRCWSSRTAPRCRSCVSPGLEEPGQWALPRCKTGPSHWPGDRREEEPQTQSSWLAQGALGREWRSAPSLGQRHGCREKGGEGEATGSLLP